MWYAVGMIVLALNARMGGIHSMAGGPVSEKFDSQAQCEQYAKKTFESLPDIGKRMSFVNCIYVDNAKK